MDENLKMNLLFLTQKTKELLSIYQHISKANGVSYSEFCILYSLIIIGGEYTQKDICDIWSFPKQTINSGTISLEKKGYIYLEISNICNNKKIIKLTEKGMNEGNKILNNIFEAERTALLTLSEEERRIGIEAIDKYTDSLKNLVFNKE